MRFLQSLVLGLLPLTAFAAKKPAADRFADFHKKALTSAPIKLTDSVYDKLTSSPRDYSVAVLLTALEQRFGCQLCREFQPEWELLAKSWTKGDKEGESRLVYGTLDFSDGKSTFQSVCKRDDLTKSWRLMCSQLGLQTAPVLLFFPPTSGPDAVPVGPPLKYDFNAAYVSH